MESVKEKQDRKKLGIIGGMGPLATAELFRLIVENTASTSDQGHIRIFIDNNPGIPDRTQAVLYGGEDPVPEMIRSARALESLGADYLLMPCNTAHYFIDRIQAGVGVPFINMVEQTALYLSSSGIRKAGLLCTTGTLRGGVYSGYLTREGIELLTPDDEGQQDVMDLIYRGVKAGNASFDASRFQRVADRLYESGAEVLILGCTELMPGIRMYGVNVGRVTEPMLVLARSAVRKAGYETVPAPEL